MFTSGSRCGLNGNVTARSYRQWCPVTKTLDVLGDRWTLLIVRDLLFGIRRFSELRAELRGISPTLLSARLSRLIDHGVVEVQPDGGYALTERGLALRPVVAEIGRWGMDLLGPPTKEEFVSELMPRSAVGFALRVESLPVDAFVGQVTLEGRDLVVQVGSTVVGRPALERVTVSDGRAEDPDAGLVTSLGALVGHRQGRWTTPELETQGLWATSGPSPARAVLTGLFSPG